GHGKQEPVVEKMKLFQAGLCQRLGRNQRVEMPVANLLHQRVGDSLTHLQLQRRKGFLQSGQEMRQQIGRYRRYNAQPKTSLENVASALCRALEIFNFRQDALDARTEFRAFRSQAYGTTTSFK